MPILVESVGSAVLCKVDLEFLGTSTDVMALTVVFVAVLPDQPHICYKLLDVGVAVVVHFPADGAQVHGFFDDLEVVEDVEFDGVHGFLEPVRSFEFEALGYYFVGCFLPEFSVASLDQFLRNGFGVGEELFQFRVVPSHLPHFLLSQIASDPFFVKKHYFVSLPNGFKFFLLFPFLQIALLNALTGHAELVGLFGPFELPNQKLSDVVEFALFSEIHCSFVVVVEMCNVRTFFNQQFAHVEVAVAGSIVERGLAGQIVHVVHSVCIK